MPVLRLSPKLNRCVQCLRKLSTKPKYQEIKIPVPWGEIRGKWWGPSDSRPILALHGWQDNCGTFDRLIPLLNNNVGFLTIDFPGHGYSSRLPPGLFYHFTTYILTIKFISKYLQWPKISLMGHSLGGIISYTYTMLYPENVDFLACLDGAKPMILKNRVTTMSKSLERFLRNHEFSLSVTEPPSYDMEEIKRKVNQPNNGSIHLENTHYIIERNAAASKLHPGKYYFIRDPRLKSGEQLSFSQDELVEQAQHITCPIFIAKFKAGSYYEVKENFYEVLDVLRRSSEDCSFHYVDGTHHAHLNNPENVAELLRNFIQKHNTQDRSIGGLKDKMMVTIDEDPRIKVAN